MAEAQRETSGEEPVLVCKRRASVSAGNGRASRQQRSRGTRRKDGMSVELASDSKVSDSSANTVFRKHAEKFPEKFRAAIDYTIQEKPRQIFVGFLLLLTIWALTCGPSCFGTSSDNFRFFDSSAEPHLMHGGAVRTKVLQVFVSLAIALVGYCFLESRDGLLVRPHPGVWRLVHGANLVYLLFLVVLMALHRDDGRQLIRLLIPSIGAKKNNVFEGTLVLDCSATWSTLKRQLTSVWFVSHFVGWFIKMWVFRSWMFNLTLSILFEFCEMSLQWLIPEFKECWWDSIFIDAIVSNLFGMIVGCATLRWFGKHHFDWLGAYPAYQKILMKFTPFSSCNYEWSFFRAPRYLLMTTVLMVLALLTEINVFFLLTALDIPASHLVNPARLGLLTLLAFPAVAEFYALLHFRHERMGGNSFLFCMILLVELMVSVKYGADRFAAATPGSDVVVPWLLSALFFGLWCHCYFAVTGRVTDGAGPVSKKKSRSCSESLPDLILKIPPLMCFLPLLYLTNSYHYGNEMA